MDDSVFDFGDDEPESPQKKPAPEKTITLNDRSGGKENCYAGVLPDLEGYGKVPLFRKRTILKDVKSGNRSTGSSRVNSASQPLPSGGTRSFFGSTSLSQPDVKPAWEEKSAKQWYFDFKHQKGIVLRVTKNLERANKKLEICKKHVKIMSEMLQ